MPLAAMLAAGLMLGIAKADYSGGQITRDSSGTTSYTGLITIAQATGVANKGLVTANANGAVVDLSGIIRMTGGENTTSPDPKYYSGVYATNSSTVFLRGDIEMVINGYVNSGIRTANANAYVLVDSTVNNASGSPLRITLTSPFRSDTIPGMNAREVAAIYAGSGTVEIRGNNNFQASQARGYGLWTGAPGAVIRITGDTDITTHGDGSYGMRVDQGLVAVNGGVKIVTEGESSFGKYGFPSYAAYGIKAGNTTTSGSVTVTGSTEIQTSGSDAHGLYAVTNLTRITLGSNNKITTAGRGANGISAGYNTVITLGSTNAILTSGYEAYGIDNSGTTTIGDDSIIQTSGTSAHGVYNFGNLTLGNNNYIHTTGTASHAFNNGIVSGHATFGGSSTLATTAASSHAVRNTGTAFFGVGSVLATEGNASNAINNTGRLTLGESGVLRTTGSAAHALYASGGTVSLAGAVDISTRGNSSHAVVISGSTAAVDFAAGGTLSTSGEAAHGIRAERAASISFDGSTRLLPAIAVSGSGSALLNAIDAKSTITLSNVSLAASPASGTESFGAKAESGGTILFDAGSSGSTALWATGSEAAAPGSIIFKNNASAAGSRVVVDANGVFDLSDASQSSGLAIGSLEGGSLVKDTAGLVNLGGNTLTVGGASTAADRASTTFSGTIRGTGDLVKDGPGILTLVGENAFRYTGGTRIDGGVLAIRIDEVLCPSFTSTITLNGGWLDLSRTTDPSFWDSLVIISGTGAQGAQAAGGIIGAQDYIRYDTTPDSTTVVDYQVGGDEDMLEQGIYLIKENEGTLVLTGSNTYVGNTRVLGGVLQISRDVNLGDTTGISPREVVLSSGTLRVTADMDSRRALELESDGAIEITGTSTVTWGGAISGSHALEKQGTGVLILTNDNPAHTGALTIASGTLQLGDGGASGLAGGDLVNNAALVINRSDDAAHTHALSGTGSLLKTAPGTFAFTQANTAYTGAVSVMEGRLMGMHIDALGTANTVDVSQDAVYELRGAGVSGTLANTVAGEGTLDITENARVEIAHANSIANASIRDGAAVVVSHTAPFRPTGRVTVGNSSILTLGVNNIQLGNLALQGGVLSYADSATGPAAFAADFKTANVASLSGTGNIIMRADLGYNAAARRINGGDFLRIAGESSGEHTITVLNTPSTPPEKNTALAIIETSDGVARFTLNGGRVESGMDAFYLYQGDGGSIMPDPFTWYLALGDRNSNAADVIIAMAAAIGIEWHYEFDSLHKRMGDLRAEITPDTREISGNVWFRANGYRLNAGGRSLGPSFREDVYGATFGIDKGWRKGSAVHILGAFGIVGHVDRHFQDDIGESDSNTLALGAYLASLCDNGWYYDLVARVDRYGHEFDARAADGFHSKARYNQNATGLSFETGRRFARANGWWVEPFAQASIAWIDSVRYATDSGITVSAGSANSAQYRLMTRFGCDNPGDARFRPYGKCGVAKVDSSGGAIQAGDDRRFRGDYDGWRAEFGFGFTYALNKESQLYLDYEYNKAATYERPWVVSLGHRRFW